ncbi:hypothetical protein FCM35_KLT21733 [Carex littledalei]|uniref:Neprosin PEP catalytic domain-containing protein n=1 Tax=Carex littledalei TaxID=544730 RepID=A0A833QFT8_9POAL|nr:hypothetical protein FCM35_KLT21733 [Carex littledalei]
MFCSHRSLHRQKMARGAIAPPVKALFFFLFFSEILIVAIRYVKDEKTKDCSLYRHDNNDLILIGWWPKTLFNNTFDHATKFVWAAEIFYPKSETSPAMGS